jgi:hypothetical protein
MGMTEANYLSRRVKLTGMLEDAEREFANTAMLAEMDGMVDDLETAAVGEKRDAVIALKNRIVGLDAAWQRIKEEMAHARATEDARRRKAVLGKMDERLAERTTAADDMVKAIDLLGEAWGRYSAANDGIQSLIRPFASDMGPDGYTHFRELFTNGFHSPSPAIGGALMDAGVKLSTHDFQAAPFRQPGAQAQGLKGFVQRHNDIIRRAAITIQKGVK